MARPSQYSQGRRLVMQAAMSVVLLGTLGLAALLGRSRERAMAVELTAKPHLTEHLAIRLPKGWDIEQTPEEGLPVIVSAMTPRNSGVKDALAAVIYQTASPPGTSEELLRQYLSDQPGTLGSLRPFHVLGRPGVLGRFESHQLIQGDPLERSFNIPGWYAAAIVPGVGPDGGDLGIVLGVKGFGAAGPAGSRLLRQLADGLSVRGH